MRFVTDGGSDDDEEGGCSSRRGGARWRSSDMAVGGSDTEGRIPYAPGSDVRVGLPDMVGEISDMRGGRG